MFAWIAAIAGKMAGTTGLPLTSLGKWLVILLLIGGLSATIWIQHERINHLTTRIEANEVTIKKQKEDLETDEKTIVRQQKNIEDLKGQVKSEQARTKKAKDFNKKQLEVFGGNTGGPIGIDEATKQKLADDFTDQYNRVRK